MLQNTVQNSIQFESVPRCFEKVGNRCDSIYRLSRHLRLCVRAFTRTPRASLSFSLNTRYLGRLGRECQLAVSESWHVGTHIRNPTVAYIDRNISRGTTETARQFHTNKFRLDMTKWCSEVTQIKWVKGDNVFSVQYPQIRLSHSNRKWFPRLVTGAAYFA